LWFSVVAALLMLGGARAAWNSPAQGDVDVMLVIALDVSGSVDAEEFDLQREGLARALDSPQIADAIAAGPHKSIAVTVVQWSGFTEQIVKINWRRVSGATDLSALAGDVRQMTRRYDGGATDIGGLLAFSAQLIAEVPWLGRRQIINIASDGTNNVNRSPLFERDLAVGKGITINALTVLSAPWTLDEYFRANVIGGPGAFVEPAENYSGFEYAMRRKLEREIKPELLF